MLYNAKEKILKLDKMTCRYITFGKGDKPLVMIQGLNTNGIKGSSIPLAFMYRLFQKNIKFTYLTITNISMSIQQLK